MNMLGLPVIAKPPQAAASRHGASFEQPPGYANPSSVMVDCRLQAFETVE